MPPEGLTSHRDLACTKADYQREREKKQIEEASGMDLFDFHAIEAVAPCQKPCGLAMPALILRFQAFRSFALFASSCRRR